MPATKCLKYCQCGVNLNHSSINHSERKQVFYRTQLAATVLVFQDKICHKARRQPSYHGNKQSAVNHSCLSFSLAGHRLNRIYIILYLVLKIQHRFFLNFIIYMLFFVALKGRTRNAQKVKTNKAAFQIIQHARQVKRT